MKLTVLLHTDSLCSTCIQQELDSVRSQLDFTRLTTDTMIRHKDCAAINRGLRRTNSPSRIERCTSPQCHDGQELRRRPFRRDPGDWRDKICPQCRETQQAREEELANTCLFDDSNEDEY